MPVLFCDNFGTICPNLMKFGPNIQHIEEIPSIDFMSAEGVLQLKLTLNHGRLPFYKDPGHIELYIVYLRPGQSLEKGRTPVIGRSIFNTVSYSLLIRRQFLLN
jgi:hypothetical protein